MKIGYRDFKKPLIFSNQLFLVLIAITLPFKNNFNSLVIICFCVTSVFFIKRSDLSKTLKKSPFWLLSVLYFLILASSLMWDNQELNAVKALESYAAFLFLVPLISLNPLINVKSIKRTNLAFVISVVVGCCICFIKATLEYSQLDDYRVFYYQYLSGQIMINAIYLSLYCSYSFFCIIYYSGHFRSYSLSKMAGILIICLFLTVTILLLSSKMIIAIHFLLCFTILVTVFKKRGKIGLGIVAAATIVVATSVLIWQMPYVKWRIEETLVKSYEGDKDNQNGLAVRFKIWQSALE